MTITLDKEFKISPLSEVCIFCKHFTGLRTCKAFPEGIPLEIWNAENKHTEPYEGDHGIQFEQRKLPEESQ